MEGPRIVALILEVSDLARSARLYSEGFGLNLHSGDNGGGDRWISGAHEECSWREGAYLHFALYQAKPGEARTCGAQVGLMVQDVQAMHQRAIAAGAIAVHPPRPEPWGLTARYLDYDGNCIGLTQAV